MSAVKDQIVKAGGLFVTGTDTGIGKTVAAACLVRALDGDYWKPVQSGLDEDSDTDTVRRLADLESGRIHPPAYELNAPLSPHEAARLEGVKIEMNKFKLPQSSRPVVAEGAGGVLVPLNHRDTMVDLMVHLALPVIVVAGSRLGTINHTLLSLEALRARNLDVIGVIVNGPANPANVEAIESYGEAPVIHQMLPAGILDKDWIAKELNI